MSRAERIIEKIEGLDETEIKEFDFSGCFAYMRDTEACLTRIIKAHEHSDVDWEAMDQAEKLLI